MGGIVTFQKEKKRVQSCHYLGKMEAHYGNISINLLLIAFCVKEQTTSLSRIGILSEGRWNRRYF